MNIIHSRLLCAEEDTTVKLLCVSGINHVETHFRS